MRGKGGIGRLRILVAFDSPTTSPDGYGGQERGWTQRHSCRAEFIYSRGSEAVDAARLQGRSIYKVKIRNDSTDANAITTAWRMRDVRRSVEYNIREIDLTTDPQWIYLSVESGVAV